MLSPSPIRLLALPGAFLILRLLSVAIGLVRAHPMPGVFRASGLLTGCTCAVAVATLMYFRADTLL